VCVCRGIYFDVYASKCVPGGEQEVGLATGTRRITGSPGEMENTRKKYIFHIYICEYICSIYILYIVHIYIPYIYLYLYPIYILYIWNIYVPYIQICIHIPHIYMNIYVEYIYTPPIIHRYIPYVCTHTQGKKKGVYVCVCIYIYIYACIYLFN